MSDQYKLYYFNFMGLAEPIRLLFAYAKIPYEDIRLDKKEEWPNLKSTFPWGKVPALQLPHDGPFICQSTSILRYLAEQHQLRGDSPLESAHCDEYTEVLADLRQEIAQHFNSQGDRRAELGKTLLDVTFPRVLGQFQRILQENGGQYLVGGRLSYADIYLAFMVGQIGNVVSATQVPEKFPELQAFEKRVMELPGIREWVAQRPHTIY